ncbi:SWIM zinc finger family protein [Streptomyces europaeiscabiei]|uniref:SWIM zinc finger family protein n=1 Tax=Streptomyces europaeiscabiei TaxID=146819 RepID=UPI0029BAACCF|nr:SWIM zinc finger family protein [Streptomyces europaeiscabiei]MDX3617783.1 SWIM zinc finger family protein [Streptomyces europaeiscabiei]MDX3630688.1 SWIM zinc finger family protein [Streptomyces europaeiscabiei]MDX3648825.1 SWIM zinc finger family protein [Streptomyces europaeiscabiei]
MNAELPPVAPDVVAAAVESLTSRLRKKLDAAIETYAAVPVTVDGGALRVRCGEDAEVTLTPGPSGAVTDAERAVCSCLLAPRCLHRAAVLSACPVADSDATADAEPEVGPSGTSKALHESESQSEAPSTGDPQAARTTDPPTTDEPIGAAGPTATGDPRSAGRAEGTGAAESTTGTPRPAEANAPTPSQVAAAAGLWAATAALLAAGVPSAGAVPQAELLRAAHTARLAGLHRAEAAALRVVRGLRGARARHDGHRLADLVANVRELLLTTGLLSAADPDPALVGTARRAYRPGGGLRVHGVCREPVISATGYGGVVTHLVSDDGRWFSVADIKPGGPARARGAATATVALGSGALDHAQLSRGGLLISGATLSPDGRLGSGKGVRATPLAGLSWTSEPLASLFTRPLAEAVAERLTGSPGADPEQAEQAARTLIGCDLVLVGAAGDHLLARELSPAGHSAAEGLLVRLTPANGHPDLAHTANFRQLAARPGLRLRVLGRLEPDRAATLRPLAIGPVPDTDATLRLPDGWQGHADLGYDRLQGAHFPPPGDLPTMDGLVGVPPDPLAEAPLWRLRRLVEVAVSGGRRAVAEPARDGDRNGGVAALRRSGFRAAADLSTALTAEADRRSRDVFGRITDPDPDRYARAWLATAVYLAGTERALVQATWQPPASGS